uniref:WAP domain-containing protein n=1 Tax=Chelonoidis abingdonii TaxID=106734 RepID=A0A8C0J6H8_CHEAB
MKPTELQLSCRNHLLVSILLGLDRVRDTRELELRTQQAEISAWSLKPGTCPVVTVRFDPPDHCQSESQCAGEEKCCDTGCGLGCVLPHPVVGGEGRSVLCDPSRPLPSPSL